MSSILKALKKLEKEHTRSGDRISLPQKLGTKKNISRWEITSGRFTRLLWAVLAVTVLCAVAGVIFYILQPTATETVSTPEPESSIKPTAQKPVRTKPPIRAQKPVRVPAPQKKASPPAAPSKSPTGPPVETAARPSPAREPTLRTAAPEPVRQPPARPTAARQDDLTELKADLTLQAISWSEQPQRRIAVVNGNIVREGGAVEGYTITRIDQNQVVVRKGPEEWKLLFKLN